MASPDEILLILQDLINAFPGKGMTDANFEIYTRHLSDIHPLLLRRAADNLINSSTWFPRVAEIRKEAARLVGSRNLSTWQPAPDVLRARCLQLEHAFFHHLKLDPAAWLSLADQFDRRDRPHAAQDTRQRLKTYQSLVGQNSTPADLPSTTS